MLVNSNDIISIRKRIDSDINKYWRVIRSENIMSDDKSKANVGSGYDLKALLNTIHQLSNKRVRLKMMLQAINLGMFDKNKHIDLSLISKHTNFETIFQACELKEELSHLETIHTLKPLTEGTVVKHKLIETFDGKAIGRMKHALLLKINKVNKQMEDYNNSTFIDLDVKKEELNLYIAA